MIFKLKIYGAVLVLELFKSVIQLIISTANNAEQNKIKGRAVSITNNGSIGLV